MKRITYLFLLLLLTSCRESPTLEPNYFSTKFSVCNESLSICNSATGDYCLFGMKWGEGNNFATTGVNVLGPKIPGGTVTYSLHEKAETVSNHRQVDVPTQSFAELPSCAKGDITQAFRDWSRMANIQFEELPEDSESDIKIFVAEVSTRGNGFPNFSSPPCQVLAGHVILSPAYTSDCEVFYAYVLHEIGHVLGLGHSSANNIMGSISGNLDGLKAGDIAGIRQIYGE